MDRISLYEEFFSSIYEQSMFQHYSSVKIRCVTIVFNTVATKSSSCFVLISGLTDETPMYYTNKKRPYDLNEYKKQRCLNFRKFTHTVSSFRSNESVIQFNTRIHKCQFKTWDWRKTLQQYFSAVDNNQYPKNGFQEIYLSHSLDLSSVKFRCVKKVSNAVATKASCCFILISKSIDETKMYDTN